MIRNKSKFFFQLIEVSTEKRTDNFCNNPLRALMQFSVLFWLIPRSNEKILDSVLKLAKKGERAASMLLKFSVRYSVDKAINQNYIIFILIM